MRNVKLSLCMIVRNEEKFLRQCLQSARPFVDEIVIIDTGSTDATPRIAAEFADYTGAYTWHDDFAAARNHALGHCTGDWVLVLDADEAIDRQAGQRIRDAIVEAHPDIGGIECTLAYDIILPNEQVARSESKGCRLFRKDARFAFTSAVHEQITPSILKAGYSIATSDIAIQHYGYSQSLQVQKQKAARNLVILDRMLQANPFDYVARYHRANSLVYLGQFADALKELQAVVENADFMPPHIMRMAQKLYEQLVQYNRQRQQRDATQYTLTDEALVDFTLNYARFRIARHLQYLPEQEKAKAVQLYALLDAVIACDSNEASAMIRAGAVAIDPEFFFDCVGGSWNASLVDESTEAARTKPEPLQEAGAEPEPLRRENATTTHAVRDIGCSDGRGSVATNASDAVRAAIAKLQQRRAS